MWSAIKRMSRRIFRDNSQSCVLPNSLRSCVGFLSRGKGWLALETALRYPLIQTKVHRQFWEYTHETEQRRNDLQLTNAFYSKLLSSYLRSCWIWPDIFHRESQKGWCRVQVKDKPSWAERTHWPGDWSAGRRLKNWRVIPANERD